MDRCRTKQPSGSGEVLPSPVVWIDFQEQVSVPAIAPAASKLLCPQRVSMKVRRLFLRHCLKAGQPLFCAFVIIVWYWREV